MNDQENETLPKRWWYFPLGLAFIVQPDRAELLVVEVVGGLLLGGVILSLGIRGRAAVTRTESKSWVKILFGLILLNAGAFTLEKELNGDSSRMYIICGLWMILGVWQLVDGFLKLRNDSLQTDASQPELTDATPPVDKITYEQDSLRWERHHHIISDLPLLLFIPFLALHFFSDNPTAWLSGFLAPLVCGVYFSVAGIHRLFEPLPPQGDASRAGKKLRRNLWILFFVLASLFTLEWAFQNWSYS